MKTQTELIKASLQFLIDVIDFGLDEAGEHSVKLQRERAEQLLKSISYQLPECEICGQQIEDISKLCVDHKPEA